MNADEMYQQIEELESQGFERIDYVDLSDRMSYRYGLHTATYAHPDAGIVIFNVAGTFTSGMMRPSRIWYERTDISRYSVGWFRAMMKAWNNPRNEVDFTRYYDRARFQAASTYNPPGHWFDVYEFIAAILLEVDGVELPPYTKPDPYGEARIAKALGIPKEECPFGYGNGAFEWHRVYSGQV